MESFLWCLFNKPENKRRAKLLKLMFRTQNESAYNALLYLRFSFELEQNLVKDRK